MNLKLHRLHSTLKMKKEVIKEDDDFLNDINDALIKEDINITEEANIDDMDVIFVETGGAEEAFFKLFPTLKAPMILLTTSKNNSLPACFEIKSFANEKEKPAIIVSGEPSDCANMISHIAKVYRAKEEINGSRLGIIGSPSDWLIYSKVDYSLVNEKFGINLIDIPMSELFKEIDKKTYSRVRHLEEIKKKWTGKEEVLEGALHIYGALKRLIMRYNLDGFTVRCFDLLNQYKNTSCLAFALLNEEGYIAGCEGDVPSMITMFILSKLNGFSTFMANPSYIDAANRRVLVAHCTCPLNMLNKYSLDTHFESGLGIGIKGELSKGSVGVFKLASNLKECLSVKATIVNNENRKEYCRTQIMLEMEPRDFIDFISLDYGNHVIISYQDDTNEFESLIELYNILHHDNK